MLYRLSYVSLDRDTRFHMGQHIMPTHYTRATQFSLEQAIDRPHRNGVERVAGIEPASSAWKAEVLPLNHTRVPFLKQRTPQRRRFCLQKIATAPKPLRMQLMVVGEGFEPSKA